MGLVSRLFSEVIMTFYGRFKSVDATGIKLLEFVEIVDPVSAQSRSVSDKLTPNGSAEPVVERDILECVNFDHRQSIVALRYRSETRIRSEFQANRTEQFIVGFRLRPG